MRTCIHWFSALLFVVVNIPSLSRGKKVSLFDEKASPLNVKRQVSGDKVWFSYCTESQACMAHSCA